ncbi:hypothetical protein ACGIF2_15560 [Cellulomonas sp. P22]|uniref:DUF7455 domain-containing protein n=1 Tax=Cellulomonas sp. P22 TaxID=3373189 RepID=UPI0037994D22
MTASTLEGSAPTTELSRHDRCDRCGAQAYVRATLAAGDGLELLFCGHHFRTFEHGLVASGATIHDERHRIEAQSTDD